MDTDIRLVAVATARSLYTPTRYYRVEPRPNEDVGTVLYTTERQRVKPVTKLGGCAKVGNLGPWNRFVHREIMLPDPTYPQCTRYGEYTGFFVENSKRVTVRCRCASALAADCLTVQAQSVLHYYRGSGGKVAGWRGGGGAHWISIVSNVIMRVRYALVNGSGQYCNRTGSTLTAMCGSAVG